VSGSSGGRRREAKILRAGHGGWLRGALASRNFRLLVSCDVISVAGSAVSLVVLPFAVLGIGGSAGDVALVATAKVLPLTACLLLGGVVADRLPRHRVLVTANVAQAIAQGTAAVLVLTGQAKVWQLAALAAAGGLALGFYYPAAQGLLPQTVPADQRQQANAIDRSGRNAAEIGGAALGGLLAGLAGPGWGLAVDAASFAVAAALRTAMRLPAIPAVERSSMVRDLRDGWREFASRRWLWINVTQFSFVAAVSVATADVLGPLVADSRLGGPRSWGFILAAYSAGAVAGGVAMIRFRPRRMLAAAVASVPAFALLLFALAVPLAVPLDVAAAFLAAASAEVFTVSWATTLQQEIPAARLSRVSSYDAFGSFVLTPVATATAGPLAAAFGASAVLAAGGGLVVLLPALVLLLPEVRQLRRQIPDPAAARADPSPPGQLNLQDGA
jgi:predicted MFS family arabinose efflux permease